MNTLSFLPFMCGVIALLAYLTTLCPTVYVEGSGELIGAAYYLGTPHPTGYPLFSLAARLVATLVPLGNPALKINIASALMGAAGVACVAWLLRSRGVRPLAAGSAALCLAFSHTYWSQSIIAEVYGLSAVMLLLAVGWCLRAVGDRSLRALLAMGWWMGVGLTAHLNQVLLGPGLLIVLVWRWPALWRDGRSLLALGAAVVFGYTLVAYLPLRNGLGPGFHWGDLSGWTELYNHLTGATYRNAFFSLPAEAMWLNARRWAASVGTEWPPLVLPLLLWGMVAAWRRDRSLLVLATSGIFTNLVVALNYHRDPNGIGVFFLLSIVCWVLLLGIGLDDVMQRIPVRLASVVGIAIAGSTLAVNYAQVDLSENRVAERYGLDILGDLPPGAVLITEGDDVAFVLDYLVRIEGHRPDITLFNRQGRGADMLSKEERRLSGRDQLALQQAREAELVRGTAPVFYLVRRRSPLSGYDFVPSGLVYQLMPSGDARRRDALARTIDMTNADFNRGYIDPWVRKIQSNYWFMQGEKQRELGLRNDALASYLRAAEVAYDSRTMQYNAGLMALRLGDIARARKHAMQAIQIDPYQPYAHQLLQRINGAGRIK